MMIPENCQKGRKDVGSVCSGFRQKHVCHLSTLCRYPKDGTRGGGGFLGLEKGTNCGLNDVELWLSRANNVKRNKGGSCSFIIKAHTHRPIFGESALESADFEL